MVPTTPFIDPHLASDTFFSIIGPGKRVAYLHSAWNESDGVRVVLFLDVLRPMRPFAAWLNRQVVKVIKLSPFIRQAKRSYDEWEREFDTAPDPGQPAVRVPHPSEPARALARSGGLRPQPPGG